MRKLWETSGRGKFYVGNPPGSYVGVRGRGVGGFCPMPYAQAQGVLNKNPHHTHPLGEYGAEMITILPESNHNHLRRSLLDLGWLRWDMPVWLDAAG